MAVPELLYGESHIQSTQFLELSPLGPNARGFSPRDRFDGQVEEQRQETVSDSLPTSTRGLCSATNSGQIEQDANRILYEKDPSRTKWEEAAIYLKEGKYNDKFTTHPQGKWSRIAYLILHHPIYFIMQPSVCILYMLLAIIEAPPVVYFRDHHNAHNSLEFLILTILSFDIVLRFIWFGPKQCIKHKRSMFIVLLLLVMFADTISIFSLQRDHFRITRALRPFFFIHTYAAIGVRRILRVIFYSMKPIIDVLLLLLFMVTIFALTGYYLFAEISFTYFSTFAQSFVSLFITLTTSNNPDVMAETYSQNSASSLFFIAYLVIMVYFTSNILLAVVYTEFSNKNRTKFKRLVLREREALIYAYSVLTGPSGISFEDFVKLMNIYKPWAPEWRIMCMFKAMQPNRNQTKWYLTQEEFFGFYEVANYKWKEGIDKVWWQKLPDKMQLPLEYIHKVVTRKWFNMIIVVVITVYNLFLTTYTLTIKSSEADARFDRLRLVIAVSFVAVLVYCGEITFKIIGIGPVNYYAKFWNVIDTAIVFTSLLCLCLETSPSYSYLLAVRPVVMARYLILRRRYRNILNTLLLIRYRLICVGLLVLVVLYFFAIIGMESFGPNENGDLIIFKGCCKTSWFGVGQFFQGPSTVPIDENIATNFSNNVFPNSSYMNTGTTNVYYLYNYDNVFHSYVSLFILMIVNNWFIIMEGVASEHRVHWYARLYFMAFYIIALVILQVIISFIVEAYVLRIQYIDKKRHCDLHKKLHRCLHTENEGYSKVKEIRLHKEDVVKLKYHIAYTDEKQQIWNFWYSIRRLNRIDLKVLEDNAETLFRGRRKQTRSDIDLLLYKDELPKWIEGHEPVLRRPTSAPARPMWRKFLKKAKKFIVYFAE